MKPSPRRAARHLLALAGLFLAPLLAPAASAEAFKLEIPEWRWSLGDGRERAEPGFDDSAWEPVELPAALPTRGSEFFWLRAELTIPPGAPDRIWLQIGKGSAACEAYVGGAFAGGRGSLPPDYYVGSTRGSVFLLPPAAAPGAKVLVALRCAFRGSSAEMKGLALVGAEEAALELGAGRFWNGTLYVILSALCLFIALFSLFQYLGDAKDLAGLYYALVMLFLSLYLHDIGADRTLIETAWFRALARSSLVLSMSFLAPFFTLFFGIHDSRKLRFASLGLGLAFAAASLALRSDESAIELLFVIGLLPVMASIFFCAYVDIRALKAGSREALPILLAVIAGLGLAGYDSFYKATGREPFAWLQGLAFFALNATVFAAIAMRQARLKAELGVYARESEKKKAELSSYLERILRAGEAVASIARELDEAAAQAQAVAAQSASASRAIDGRAAGQAQSASRTDELVSSFAESASRVEKSIAEQAGGVERTAAAATELTANAESVAANIAGAASFTEGLADQTSAGQEAARALEAAMDKIQAGSAGIGEIVEAMNQFAERTNLLAMNAAIEAAHSGASGRGFAIIANEVKKLAQAQSERAALIRDEVGGIESRVAEGARNAASLRSALAGIAAGAVGAAERLAEVREGTKEQVAASVEIRDAMSDLSRASQAIREESVKQAAMAEKASSAVASVSEGAADLRSQASSIAREDVKLVEATKLLVDLAARCRELTASLASDGQP